MKKKDIIGIGVAVIVGVSLFAYGAMNKMDIPDKQPKKLTVQEVKSQNNAPVEKTDVKEKASYESLLGLDYTLLRADKLEEAGVDTTLQMDIQVEKPLSEEQVSSLGKEAYGVLAKELDKAKHIASVQLNVFTTKEAFEQTKKTDYKGGYIEGWVQSYSSSHTNGNQAVVKTYNGYESTADVESMDASMDFDVVDTNQNEKLVTADVVMTIGTKEQVEDMIQSISSMIKESNTNVEQVELRIYANQKDFEEGKLAYEYSPSHPNVLAHQIYQSF